MLYYDESSSKQVSVIQHFLVDNSIVINQLKVLKNSYKQCKYNIEWKFISKNYNAPSTCVNITIRR